MRAFLQNFALVEANLRESPLVVVKMRAEGNFENFYSVNFEKFLPLVENFEPVPWMVYLQGVGESFACYCFR